jgi:hypothetical protein
MTADRRLEEENAALDDMTNHGNHNYPQRVRPPLRAVAANTAGTHR